MELRSYKTNIRIGEHIIELIVFFIYFGLKIGCFKLSWVGIGLGFIGLGFRLSIFNRFKAIDRLIVEFRDIRLITIGLISIGYRIIVWFKIKLLFIGFIVWNCLLLVNLLLILIVVLFIVLYNLQ